MTYYYHRGYRYRVITMIVGDLGFFIYPHVSFSLRILHDIISIYILLFCY